MKGHVIALAIAMLFLLPAVPAGDDTEISEPEEVPEAGHGRRGSLMYQTSDWICASGSPGYLVSSSTP